MVEVRCFRKDCRNNKKGLCQGGKFEYIEIDEDGYCVAYEGGGLMSDE